MDTSKENKESNLIQLVKTSLAKAEKGESKLNGDVLSIGGMSSPKIRHLLNSLCSEPYVKYLEIGFYTGSTFVSALYGNLIEGIAVDDLSQCKGEDPQKQHNGFVSNLMRFIPESNIKVYETDYLKVNKNDFSSKINVYFYDGDHTLEGQESAFIYYNDVLDDVFVTVVDDWNWKDTQNGTFAAFKKLNYTVLFEKSLYTSSNGNIDSWWNGIYIAVIKKP